MQKKEAVRVNVVKQKRINIWIFTKPIIFEILNGKFETDTRGKFILLIIQK